MAQKDFDLELDLSQEEQDKKDPSSDNVWVTGFEASDVVSFVDKINSVFETDPKKPIVINICSTGGTVVGLFAMQDAMDAIRGRADKDFFFVTHAIGAAMSSACDLLAHGDLRLASDYCTIMTHQASEGDPDADRLNYLSFERFKTNCNYDGSVEDIMFAFIRAKYMNPKEALDFGIIDDIGAPVLAKRDGKYIILVKKSKGRRDVRIRRK